jgi:hypothetical protein
LNSYSHLSLSLLFHTSFIHPIPLPSSLSISRCSLPSLSLISSHPLHMCSIVSLSSGHILHLLSSLSILFSLSLRSCILITPSFSFLSHSLSPDTPQHPLSCISRFSDSLPSVLLVRISVPLAQLSTHPSSFRSQSFQFLTGIPIPPVALLSLLLIRILFLFSITLSQYPALVPSAHSVFELCRSLSRFHSQLVPLTLFPHYVLWCFSVHS